MSSDDDKLQTLVSELASSTIEQVMTGWRGVPTTYAEAMAWGDQFMEFARLMVLTTYDKATYSRLEVTGNRWDHANFLQTRALSYYQLAALLKS
jgi:hypothetical protein